MIRIAVQKAARKLGYDIRKITPRHFQDEQLACLLARHCVDLVIDVGANNGGYGSMLRERGYCGRILSFEPLSAAHAQLIEHVRGDKLWTVAPRMALGSAEGETVIHVSANSYSSSLAGMLDAHTDAAPGSGYVAEEKVSVNTLDSLWGNIIPADAKSVFLKIDVQGYEHQVLAGAADLMSRIRGLQIELSFVPLYEGQLLFENMLALIQRRGLALHTVVPGFMDPKTCRTLQADGIFFR
jgi:FkbM family methyltransferase